MTVLSFFPISFTAAQAWALSSQGTPYSVDKYTNADDNLLSFRSCELRLPKQVSG